MEVSLGFYRQNVSVTLIVHFISLNTPYPPAKTMPPARIIPAIHWHKTCIPLQGLGHVSQRDLAQVLQTQHPGTDFALFKCHANSN